MVFCFFYLILYVRLIFKNSNMNKTLTLSSLALAGFASLQVSAASADKPNIIFIFADDLGYGDVTCLNPDSKIPTPFFDKLAKTAQVYTDAHTNSSVSTPSRYGVITGRYAWRSTLKKGVLYGYDKALIEPDRPTVASMLRDNGYKTLMVGKWHIGIDGWVSTDASPVVKSGKNVDFKNSKLVGPYSLGFDYFYGISASLDMPPFLIIENDRVIDEPDYFYEFAVDSKQGVVNPYGAKRDGHAIKSRHPNTFLSHFTDKAVELIKENSKGDKPFFMYFPLNAPHMPVAPHPDFQGKSGVDSFGDFVMEIDARVAQVYKALEECGIAENTLVVISSDNGPEAITYKRFNDTGHTSSGQLKGVKRDVWEGGHRVPMFVSWPAKIKKGAMVDHTVCLLDFYATVAELVGHKVKDGECPDSHSYLPSILGKKQEARDYTIHHSVKGNFAIRKGDWVLVEKKTGGDLPWSKEAQQYYKTKGYVADKTANGELFNVKEDIQQRKNVYAEHPEIVAELTALLNECRKAKK